MRKVYRVYYRGPDHSVFIRPMWVDYIATSADEARKKFRKMEPFAVLIEVRQL